MHGTQQHARFAHHQTSCHPGFSGRFLLVEVKRTVPVQVQSPKGPSRPVDPATSTPDGQLARDQAAATPLRTPLGAIQQQLLTPPVSGCTLPMLCQTCSRLVFHDGEAAELVQCQHARFDGSVVEESPLEAKSMKHLAERLGAAPLCHFPFLSRRQGQQAALALERWEGSHRHRSQHSSRLLPKTRQESMPGRYVPQ